MAKALKEKDLEIAALKNKGRVLEEKANILKSELDEINLRGHLKKEKEI